MIKHIKDNFIHKEIWLLTTMGGFQRANLYNKDVSYIEIERKNFREALHIFIKNIALTQYVTKTVDKDTHISNIKSISGFTAESEFSYLLNNGQLNFGISQKLLNLYLKYLWCMDKIETPPHFPVDRIIQENLNKEAKKYSIEAREITAWTQMETESEYMEVILYAINILERSDFKNLAELELELFENF